MPYILFQRFYGMSEQLFQEIRSIEDQAEKIISDSENQSAEILRKAKEQSAKMLNDNDNELKNLKEKEARAALTEALKSKEIILDKEKKSVERLKNHAHENKEKAAELILEKLSKLIDE